MLSSAVPDLLSSNLPDTSSFSDMALLVSIPSDGKAHDNDNENENEEEGEEDGRRTRELVIVMMIRTLIRMISTAPTPALLLLQLRGDSHWRRPICL